MRYLEFKPHSPAKIRIYLCPGLGFRGAGQIARQIASGKTLIRIPRYTMTFLVLVFIESIIRTRICDGLVCEFKINDLRQWAGFREILRFPLNLTLLWTRFDSRVLVGTPFERRYRNDETQKIFLSWTLYKRYEINCTLGRVVQLKSRNFDCLNDTLLKVACILIFLSNCWVSIGGWSPDTEHTNFLLL